MIKKVFFFLIFTLFINQSYAKENIMILKLKNGNVVIELFDDVVPNHVKRFKLLAEEKKYDGLEALKEAISKDMKEARQFFLLDA